MHNISYRIIIRTFILPVLSVTLGLTAIAENRTVTILSKSDLPGIKADYTKLVVTDQNELLAVTSVRDDSKTSVSRLNVWFSGDQGTTWEHKGQLPEEMSISNYRHFSAGMGFDKELVVIYPTKSPDNLSEILAVYVSQDKGETWSLRGHISGELPAQGYLPSGRVTVADGGYLSEDGISGEISKEAGKPRLCCFLKAPSGLPGNGQPGSSVLCWSNNNGRSWEVASTVESKSRDISAVFTKGGAWDNTWFAAVKTFFTGPGTDLYRSYNGGLHWRNEVTLTNGSSCCGELLFLPANRLAYVYIDKISDTGKYAIKTRYTDRMKPARYLGGMAWREDCTLELTDNTKSFFCTSVALSGEVIMTLTGNTDHRGKMNVSAIKWKLPEPYKDEPEVKAELSSNIILAGDPVTVRVLCENPKSKPVMVMQNFVDSNEVLPGFEYDAVREIAWIGTKSMDNKIRLITDEWSTGVHFFSVIDLKKYSADYKDLAITVREENPWYETEEIKNYKSRIIPLVRLPDGLILASGGFSSKDGGVTWDKDREEVRGNGCLLRSGEIFILSGCKTTEKKGHYIMNGYISNDKLKTASPVQGDLYLPQFIPGFAHGYYKAPLFHRSVLELPDGTLLATMYGRFKGDNDPQIWEGDQRAMRMRSFLVASTDMGKTWTYRSTIADPADAVTMEGFDETSMILLSNSELLCAVRSGDNAHAGWNQNNLYLVRSSDEGLTWGKPRLLKEEGASPHLYLMQDGSVVCSFERPGSSLMFSDDNGKTWGSYINLDAGRYRGYGTICEVRPNILLFTHQGQHSFIRVTKNKLK